MSKLRQLQRAILFINRLCLKMTVMKQVHNSYGLKIMIKNESVGNLIPSDPLVHCNVHWCATFTSELNHV